MEIVEYYYNKILLGKASRHVDDKKETKRHYYCYHDPSWKVSSLIALHDKEGNEDLFKLGNIDIPFQIEW